MRTRTYTLVFAVLLMLTLQSAAQAHRTLFTDSGARGGGAQPAVIGATRTRFVSINSGALAQAAAMLPAGRVPQDTGLILNLFDDATYLAVNTRLEARPSGAAGYVWIGSIPAEPNSRVVMVVEDGGLTGQINLVGRGFALETVQPGVVAISEVASSAQHPALVNDGILPPAPHTVSSAPGVGTPNTPSGDSGDTIDVMVVYTARAASTGSIQSKIDSMVSVANTSYADSGVNQRIRLVYSGQVSYTEAAASPSLFEMGKSLDALTYTQGTLDPTGSIDNVHTLRDDYKADLVSLITYENSYEACGLAWILNTLDPGYIGFAASYAFSVVDVRCYGPYFSFAHELGHTMGGLHDHFNAGAGAGLFAYAYGYQDKRDGPGDWGDFTTIMAYPINGECPAQNQNWASTCTPIGRWSDPAQTYSGKALGSSGSSPANMVQTLNNTASFVANYRVSSLESFDLISPADGDTYTDPALTLSWEAVDAADTYTVKVTTTSGFLYTTAVQKSAVCESATCTYTLTSAFKPPYAERLRWQIKASSSAGNSSSSAKWKLYPDLLTSPVVTTSPPNAATVNSPLVPLTWARDTRADQYRIKITLPDGTGVTVPWTDAATLCPTATCAYDLDLSSFATPGLRGAHTWKIEARRHDASGKAKSAAQTFTLTPRVTLTSPANGATFADNQFAVTWAQDPVLDEYRFNYRALPDGTTVRSAWQPAAALCPDACTRFAPLPADLSGSIEWWVEGRATNFTGKVKSERRQLTQE